MKAPRARAIDASRAPAEFANEIEAFLGYISLERGLAKNTIAGYRRDLDQAAEFFAARGAGGWKAVSGAQAAEWSSLVERGRLRDREPGAKAERVAEPGALSRDARRVRRRRTSRRC